jgi:hypothetical protein
MIEVGRLLKNCRTRLEGLVSFRSIEIRERGGRTTPQALAIADPSDERIKLAVERFGRTAPERTEMLPLNFKRSARVICREDFCKQLRRVLAENFPDETVEKVSVAFDLEHPLSGMYARGVSRRQQVRGDLSRYGYFANFQLRSAPTLFGRPGSSVFTRRISRVDESSSQTCNLPVNEEACLLRDSR